MPTHHRRQNTPARLPAPWLILRRLSTLHHNLATSSTRCQSKSRHSTTTAVSNHPNPPFAQTPSSSTHLVCSPIDDSAISHLTSHSHKPSPTHGTPKPMPTHICNLRHQSPYPCPTPPSRIQHTSCNQRHTHLDPTCLRTKATTPKCVREV